MRCDLRSIRGHVDLALDPVGLTWAALAKRASQIILFGSRAAGVAGHDSDWDLLLVGEGHAVRSRELDIVWIRPAMIRSESWLGSELASHVAVYGRWLLGPDDWRYEVRISPDA